MPRSAVASAIAVAFLVWPWPSWWATRLGLPSTLARSYCRTTRSLVAATVVPAASSATPVTAAGSVTCATAWPSARVQVLRTLSSPPAATSCPFPLTATALTMPPDPVYSLTGCPAGTIQRATRLSSPAVISCVPSGVNTAARIGVACALKAERTAGLKRKTKRSLAPLTTRRASAEIATLRRVLVCPGSRSSSVPVGACHNETTLSAPAVAITVPSPLTATSAMAAGVVIARSLATAAVAASAFRGQPRMRLSLVTAASRLPSAETASRSSGLLLPV